MTSSVRGSQVNDLRYHTLLKQQLCYCVELNETGKDLHFLFVACSMRKLISDARKYFLQFILNWDGKKGYHHEYWGRIFKIAFSNNIRGRIGKNSLAHLKNSQSMNCDRFMHFLRDPNNMRRVLRVSR